MTDQTFQATASAAVVSAASPPASSPSGGLALCCGACGRPLRASFAALVMVPLALLREPRRSRLAEMYDGQPPALLCWLCFKATVSVLNGVTQPA